MLKKASVVKISAMLCIGWLLVLGFNPFPNDKFYTSKLKEFAEDNFKLDVNRRKFSQWVENTVGKGEIACSEQFFLFPVFSIDFY